MGKKRLASLQFPFFIKNLLIPPKMHPLQGWVFVYSCFITIIYPLRGYDYCIICLDKNKLIIEQFVF
jgi:hypothetical protein